MTPTFPIEIWELVASFVDLNGLYQLKMCSSSMQFLTNELYIRAMNVQACVAANLEQDKKNHGYREDAKCDACGMNLGRVGFWKLSAQCPFPYCRHIHYLAPAAPIVKYSLTDKYPEHRYMAKEGALIFETFPVDTQIFHHDVVYVVQRKDKTTGGKFKEVHQVIRRNSSSDREYIRRRGQDSDVPIQIKVRARLFKGCDFDLCFDSECCKWTPWSEPSVPFLPPNESEIQMGL